MRRGSALGVLGATALALLLATAFTPLAPALARRLASPGRLGPADAIVVLGAAVSADGTLSGASLRRTVYGIRLHRRGMAPLLVFSGAAARPPAPAESAVRAALASELGLSGPAVLTLGETWTTFEEGEKARDLLGPRGVRRILLVTESLHLVRATSVFERAGFAVLPAPADGELDAQAPEERLNIARELAQELLARTIYRLTGRA